MTASQLKRLPVWGKSLRLSHWFMTLAVLILLLTGWLMGWAPERAERIGEFHNLAAAVLIAALVVRLSLLFTGKGSDRLLEMLPSRHRLGQGWKVLRSYLTLGKIPLPKWYAHNPLWGPIYLLLFAVLTIQVLSGLLLLNQVTLIGGFSLRWLHGFGYLLILGFTLLHIAAVFFHDAKTTGSDVSAMINGHRIFTIEPLKDEQSGSHAVISLDSLRQTIKHHKSAE